MRSDCGLCLFLFFLFGLRQYQIEHYADDGGESDA